jgi:hypothetical protein
MKLVLQAMVICLLMIAGGNARARDERRSCQQSNIGAVELSVHACVPTVDGSPAHFTMPVFTSREASEQQAAFR